MYFTAETSSDGVHDPDLVVSKRHWVAQRVDELPFVMHRLFSAMLTGRPGPVHLEVPMDVQAETADVQIHELARRLPVGKVHPDPQAVTEAVDLLAGARRPVIVVGGGAITANAAPQVRRLAEHWGVPVVTTWNGKGAFPEDHELFAGSVGQTGTPVGNGVASTADVVVAVGCRFTDWSASSYARGVSFSIPDAKLIHIDLDPQEIGKNYPAEVGIVADAAVAVGAIADELPRERPDRAAYAHELAERKAEWETQLAKRRDSDRFPFTSQHPLGALRAVLPREAIIVVGSGNTRARSSRPSRSTSRAPTSPPAASRRWAGRCPRRSAPSSAHPTGRWSACWATATS